MELDPDEILTCFSPYRPDGYTTPTAVANLDEHLDHRGFRNDIGASLAARAAAEQVAGLIIDDLDVMADDLTAGAIATFVRGNLRAYGRGCGKQHR